jgi:hypothetical protein
MSHTHNSDASKPAVKARSTTCGTHSKEASNPAISTTAMPRDGRDHGDWAKGNSTTANKAHAANIQLTNKGTTAVDGLLVNGLSQGKAMQATKMALRSQRL